MDRKYMCPKVSVQPVFLAVALVASLVSALIGLLIHVNLRMAPQVSLANEALVADRAFERLIVCLNKKSRYRSIKMENKE